MWKKKKKRILFSPDWTSDSYAPKRGFFRMMMKNERRGEVKLFLPNLSNMDLYTIYMFIFT